MSLLLLAHFQHIFFSVDVLLKITQFSMAERGKERGERKRSKKIDIYKIKHYT